jgi:transcriptional regulator with XRE-family HTH domain
LAEARKAAGLTQEKIAEAVGVERQTVSDWERGISTPHPGQREAYAEAINISMTELASMLSSMPVDAGEIPAWLAQYLNAEQSAVEMRVHEPKLVDVLLQTPAYVEAVVRCVGLAGVTDDYVRQNIQQRQHRQKRVRDGELALEVIQAEQVLHIRLGDTAVMAEQLATMAELAELPNVTIRVMTFDAGQYEARRLDTFCIMRHPWGNPAVQLSGYGGGRMITDAEEVAYFVDAFDHATKLALSPGDSVTLIRDMASKWEARR